MKLVSLFFLVVLIGGCSLITSQDAEWLVVDDFESNELIGWENHDTQNETQPYVTNPQVTEIRVLKNSRFLMKKPAIDGVVGNRKALSFKKLPVPIQVGETSTFFMRIFVERFPNNHVFGLSNLRPAKIIQEGYNAFEPMLRVTDKYESNGFKNDGTLMVKIDSDDKYRQYSKVQNYKEKRSAQPLNEKVWYDIWYVVNNATLANKGQNYDVYVKGGEFKFQTLVYNKANFRMKREMPLIYFMANTNTGSIRKPYGNGGLAYDDIYMSRGVNLTKPL